MRWFLQDDSHCSSLQCEDRWHSVPLKRWPLADVGVTSLSQVRHNRATSFKNLSKKPPADDMDPDDEDDSGPGDDDDGPEIPPPGARDEHNGPAMQGPDNINSSPVLMSCRGALLPLAFSFQFASRANARTIGARPGGSFL
mmetsp:Transcript_107900/g.170427  ORF Transcript_107900/g.170427 Transcript_107900/m.170427 type:complete len:141 (+) Transcript_107900:68-490(+)